MLELLRRQIDKQIELVKDLNIIERPNLGWIRSIRESLGMTRKQLSKKMGVSSQSIEKMEKSEASDTISLKTLRNAAAALDCRLVYVLIPKEPLQKTVEKQIIKKATNIADTISHTMKLEDQGTSQEELSEQIKDIIADIKRRKNISLIWEDD